MSDIRATVDAAAQMLVEELGAVSRRMESHGAGDDDSTLQAAVDTAVERCLTALQATGLRGRDIQPAGGDFWKIAGEMLFRGDLQWRARSKPRGYAGDYLLQADFWSRSECSDPLGRLFDRYFQKQQAVEAVRGRMRLVGGAIARRCWESTHEEFRVVSVGSGPGIDLELAAAALPAEARHRLRLTLIDLDEAALEFAQARLVPHLSPAAIRLCRENVGRLTRGRRGAELLHDADFVVCAGLFDYLADAEAAAMLRLFAASLRPGGVFYVGNFAPHCTTRAYMEWIGNWYLAYRTGEELRRLAAAAELASTRASIVAESTGADLFLVYEAPTHS